MPFGILLADLIFSDSLLRGQSTLFAIGRKSKFHLKLLFLDKKLHNFPTFDHSFDSKILKLFEKFIFF